MRAVRLSGMGGFELGGIELDETFSIPVDPWERFLTLIEKTGFWDMPVVVCDPPLIDGSTWILEGLRGANYHLVKRTRPELAYLECCRYLLKLSKLQIQEDLLW